MRTHSSAASVLQPVDDSFDFEIDHDRRPTDSVVCFPRRRCILVVLALAAVVMVAVALAVITQSAQLAATTPSSSSPVTMSSPLLPPPSPPQPSDGACSMIDENALSGIVAACGQMQDGVPDRQRHRQRSSRASGCSNSSRPAVSLVAAPANRSDALLARYQPPVGTWRDEGRCGVDAATEEGAAQGAC